MSTGPFPPNPNAFPQGPPPSDDGWGKVGVLMVLVALAFAGGVAYFIATSDQAEGSEAGVAAAEGEGGAESAELAEGAENAAAAEADPADAGAKENNEGADTAAALIASEIDGGPAGDASDEADQDTVAVADTTSADAGPEAAAIRANGELDRPTGLVSMSIESEPAGAQVIRKSDGVRLGTTPYRYEVESASGSITFILKLDGHRSKSIKIPTNRDSVRQVMLFPGKGGDPIPEPAPAEVVASTKKSDTKVASVTAEKAADKAPKAAVVKPKVGKKVVRKKAIRRPRKPRPKKTKPKKSGGKVDYTAVPIPLD